MYLEDNINDLDRLIRQFGRQGLKFEFWGINGYSTPDGEDVAIEDGTCVTVDSRDGEAYAEWIFDPYGELVQFFVWHTAEFDAPFVEHCDGVIPEPERCVGECGGCEDC